MDHSRRIIRRRLTLLTAVGVLLAGGGASALIAAPARASTCTAGGGACALTGTLTLGAGTLNMTTSSSLSWTSAASGADLQLVDPTVADETYTVVDATGSGAGWHVTVSATTFTATGGTLTNTGTFSTNGSLTSITGAVYPTAACSTGSTCTVPTHTTTPTTFPVAITTAPTTPVASVIYDANAATGTGSIAIGGSTSANPVGWWLAVPGNTKAGTYTSTISMAIVTAP